MITLYYIRGITRLDEPLFILNGDQEDFFKAHIVNQIDTGFYPPHFHNEITLSTDDIALYKNYNYLSLSYNDKEYYYFIDSIEYVSEDVINVKITMDTIQTFMFNMVFEDTYVTRMSIPRWTKTSEGYIINRDYIRENLSQGKFVTLSYDYEFPDISWYIVWVRTSGDLYYDNNGTKTALPVDNVFELTNGRTSSYYYRKADIYCTPLCIPVSNNPDYPNIQVDGSPASANFEHLVEAPAVIKIVRIDKDILGDYFNVTRDNGTYYLTTISTSLRLAYPTYWKDSDGNYHYISSVVIPANTLIAPKQTGVFAYDDELPPISQNTQLKADASSNYIPAMLDENYIHVYYGEQMNYITYPVHQLKTLDIWYVNITDWLSGTRIYAIMDSEYKGDFIDPYTSIGICNTQEYLDLYNDAWLNYYSRNTATWTMGYQLNKQQLLYSYYMGSTQNILNTVGSMMGGAMHGQASNMLLNTGQFSDSMIPAYMGNQGRMIGTAIQGVSKQIGIIGDWYQNNYVLDEQRKITKGDYEATPDTEKQGNTLTADTLIEATMTIKKVDIVDDYDNVALTYERTGYKVSKRIYSKSLFDYANVRYYYNCITAEVYSMSLDGYITDEATITNIKARFASGLRLWNVTSGSTHADYIGDFQYDNVEN